MLRLLGGALLVLVFASQLVRRAGCGAGGVPYCAVSCGPVMWALVPQCTFCRLGWPGLCSGVGAFHSARQAGLSVTIPCSPAGAGGLVGPAR